MKSTFVNRFYGKLTKSSQWTAHTVSTPILPLIIALLVLALSCFASIQSAFSYNQKNLLWKV